MDQHFPILYFFEQFVPSEGTAPLQQVPLKKAGGYPDNLFLTKFTEQEREKYECTICYMIVKKARQCKNGHIYCATCIYNWSLTRNANSVKCPVCRADGPYEKALSVDFKLGDALIKCTEESCPWVGRLSLFKNHEHGEEEERNAEQLPSIAPLEERYVRSSDDGDPRGIGRGRLPFRVMQTQLQRSRERLAFLLAVLGDEIEARRRSISSFRDERQTQTDSQIAEVNQLGARLNIVATNLMNILATRVLDSPEFVENELESPNLSIPTSDFLPVSSLEPESSTFVPMEQTASSSVISTDTIPPRRMAIFTSTADSIGNDVNYNDSSSTTVNMFSVEESAEDVPDLQDINVPSRNERNSHQGNIPSFVNQGRSNLTQSGVSIFSRSNRRSSARPQANATEDELRNDSTDSHERASVSSPNISTSALSSTHISGAINSSVRSVDVPSRSQENVLSQGSASVTIQRPIQQPLTISPPSLDIVNVVCNSSRETASSNEGSNHNQGSVNARITHVNPSRFYPPSYHEAALSEVNNSSDNCTVVNSERRSTSNHANDLYENINLTSNSRDQITSGPQQTNSPVMINNDGMSSSRNVSNVDYLSSSSNPINSIRRQTNDVNNASQKRGISHQAHNQVTTTTSRIPSNSVSSRRKSDLSSRPAPAIQGSLDKRSLDRRSIQDSNSVKLLHRSQNSPARLPTYTNRLENKNKSLPSVNKGKVSRNEDKENVSLNPSLHRSTASGSKPSKCTTRLPPVVRSVHMISRKYSRGQKKA